MPNQQRCQIYALNKTGLSQNKIAKQLSVSQATISREFFGIQVSVVIVLSKLKYHQPSND
ncbi:helix-turn-helix domain-containing protein [Psychromonas sp. MB-3u-54]|nr:helix-turn-helix domain-containing protein [Psychromonas sp. MB-3u-54]PKH04481.1 helix-turn-helix domain-containing protein [Psychromonas sp. MB-3u-54]